MQGARAAAVAKTTGLSETAAAWTAFAALHAGVFTRAQCTAWFGEPPDPTARQACSRTIRALAKRQLADELQVPRCGSVLHIRHRSVYRALGDPENRHRRRPAPAKAIERLLGLDFVLEHRTENWLPTEADKTQACASLGIDREDWPHKVYESDKTAETTVRFFVEKWPLAISDRRAAVCVVAPGSTLARLASWQETHGPLIRALGSAGLELQLVHISHREDLAAPAQRALDTMAARLAQGDADSAELKRIKAAILTCTVEAAAPWGGWDGMLARAREIHRRGTPRGAPPIQAQGTAWTSWRVRTRPAGDAA